MSKKSSKWRDCPAVQREITAAECGENRVSRYACPAECPYNPFAPVNYDHLLELEGVLDRHSVGFMLQTAKNRHELESGLERAINSRSGHAPHAFVEWNFFFKRDATELSCAQRWERAGFSELNNDERALLRAKMRTRVALLEVHCVRDHERTEVVDLLDRAAPPFLIQDRGLAGQAVRFASFLSWAYPLPHFWRLSGTAIVVPELAQFEPAEIVTEVVRHLGGPVTEPELRVWLAEHFVRFEDALYATSRARRLQMFAGLDAQFGKALYELCAPFAECRETLDAKAAVDFDRLTEQERDEGFAEARVWFADEAKFPHVLPEGGRPALGRVLMGQAHWRLEAIGAERLADLRAQFEARLGSRVKFTGERRDDFGGRLAAKEPKVDATLVPPRLLENPQKILLTASRVPLPASDRPREQLDAELRLAHDRAFLDDHVPALDGRTPREAARDATVRPKLIRLLKQRVRLQDEENLRTGRTHDINWLLRELGASEILFDPPPWREPPEPGRDAYEDEDADWDDDAEISEGLDLPVAPPLPKGPFDFEEATKRLHAGLDVFDTAAAAMDELSASGSTLLEDAGELTEELLSDEEYSFLVPLLLQAWFALVPPGTRAPEMDFDDLADAFVRENRAILGALSAGSLQKLQGLLNHGRQPALVQLLTSQLLDAAAHAPKKLRPRLESQPIMLAVVKAVVEELDRVLREESGT